MRRLIGVLVAVAVVAACSDSRHEPPSAMSAAEHPVAIDAHATDTVLHFDIESGTCSQATRPTLRPVIVKETATAVTVTARVRHPPSKLKRGAFCAGVGIGLPFDVTLKEPLGRRKLLDGTCSPPDDMLRRFNDINEPGDMREPCTPTADELARADDVGTWSSFPAGPLQQRGEAFGVWTGSEMIVIGGLDIAARKPLSDGAAYNPNTRTWRPLPPVPEYGRLRGVAPTGKGLFVLRQDSPDEGVYDVTHAHIYDAASNEWRTTSPPPRPLHTGNVFWTGDAGVVWDERGGYVYRPASDTWEEIPGLTVRGGSMGASAHWIRETKELAVPGAFDPMNGKPGRAALLLYKPATKTWRMAPELPVVLRAFTFVPAFSLDDVVVYDTSDNPEQTFTFTYTPAKDKWTKLPPWRDATTPDRGGTPDAVELADQRIVLRVTDPFRPLFIYSHGTWQHAANPPDPAPNTDGVVVSAGDRVLMWGQPKSYEPLTVGWEWTPPVNA